MGKFEELFGSWVVKYRWCLIIASILVLVVSASGARFLTFNNDTRVFFSDENPQLQALEALENTYSRIDNVRFVLAPQDGDVFTRETLTVVEELTRAAWQLPYSSRVDSISNFQHTRAENDDLLVADLIEDAKVFTPAELEQVKSVALAEPLLLNRLISDRGHVTAVNVNVILPGKSMAEVPEVADYAESMAADFRERHPEITLYLVGSVMSNNAFGEAGKQDMATLMPAMLLILVVIAGLALRSVSGTFATLFIILMSMLTGMGLAGWLGISITAASANAPTIILTLAVADSVHVLASVYQQMRLGKAKLTAIIEAVRINLQPIFLTSVTTIIGFLAMNFSDAPPFRDLGNIVALGVAAAFVYSVFFLPAFMAVLPLRVRSTENTAADSRFSRLADCVIAQRKRIFWATMLVMLTLTAGTSRIELNDDWMKYFDESFAIRRATDFTTENLTGYDVIEYSLESGESGGINNPEYLATVDEFVSWYRQQPNVVNVNSITDTMKRLNMNMHGDDSSWYRVPQVRELAAQYLLLYEMSLPFGLDLNNQINVDKSGTRMVVTMKEMTTKDLREMDTKARIWLRNNAPASMQTYGSGLSIIWSHISERNINSMLGASVMALVLISMLLIFALRSFKLGLLSLVPNLVPAFMAFGVWGYSVGQVGLGLTVIGSMTLGIVVDDTVHFMSKYLRARREHNMSPADAVRYSFRTVGQAMWITTLALVSGFMVLTLSGYNMSADMGLLSAITITLALALDFLFLPVILMKVEEKADETTATDIDPVPALVTADGDG